LAWVSFSLGESEVQDLLRSCHDFSYGVHYEEKGVFERRTGSAEDLHPWGAPLTKRARSTPAQEAHLIVVGGIRKAGGFLHQPFHANGAIAGWGRVEDWRGLPKVKPICSSPFPLEWFTSRAMIPFPMPAASNRADFPQWTFLFASLQGLCDVWSWTGFRECLGAVANKALRTGLGKTWRK
jgi:hypothetical protein